MKILIADDHALVLMGIRHALEADGGFEVVGSTRSGSEVLPLVGQLAPDVVLLDLQLPKLDGLDCIVRVLARYPAVKVVMLSMFAEHDQVQTAFERGASGFITKSIDVADLPAAIRQAIAGTVYHAVGLPAAGKPGAANAAGLTERELTILRAVARGLSNDAVAKELWVTEATVKFHLTHVFRKIGVANRTGAVRWAFARGFADAPAPASPSLKTAA